MYYSFILIYLNYGNILGASTTQTEQNQKDLQLNRGTPSEFLMVKSVKTFMKECKIKTINYSKTDLITNSKFYVLHVLRNLKSLTIFIQLEIPNMVLF